MELKAYLARREKETMKAIDRYVPVQASLIVRAMRYSLFAGGKRLRPMLVIEGAVLCGGTEAMVMPAACALEMIHTYSLIHDDLPAMDNDDLRRGKPTSHRKFGEATAILAGDALLTDAFRVMTLCSDHPKVKPASVVAAVAILARHAGFDGMIGGQMQDTVEGNTWAGKGRSRAARTLEYIHLNKTAALIRASLTVGATLAGGDRRRIDALDSYGRNVGLAFQIADDILDIVGNKKLLGKRGSDRDNNKLTWPALYGLDASQKMARDRVNEAKEHIALFEKKADILSQLADYAIERQY